MSELTTDHYRMLLCLDEDWSVDAVTFDPSGKRVVINISFAGSKRMCASHSRFTLLFEVFAIEVLCACANVSPAAGLLGLSWDAMHSIIERAVEHGLDRRSLDNIEHVGVDEKSFGKGTRQMWLYNMENLDEDRWKLLRMINDDDYAWKQVE